MPSLAASTSAEEFSNQDVANALPTPTALIPMVAQTGEGLHDEDYSIRSCSSFNNSLRFIGLLALVTCVLSIALGILLVNAGAHIGSIVGSLVVFFAGVMVSFDTQSFLRSRVVLMLIFGIVSAVCSIVTYLQYSGIEACVRTSCSSKYPSDSSTYRIYDGDDKYFPDADMCLKSSSSAASKTKCFCATTSSALDGCITVPVYHSSCSAVVHGTPIVVLTTLLLSMACLLGTLIVAVWLRFLIRASLKLKAPTASAVYLTQNDLTTVTVPMNDLDSLHLPLV